MATPLLDALVLGVLEGAAEFLPISSTGHLILASAAMGHDPADQVTFNIVIQLGAILAILVAYRARLVTGAAGLLRRDPVTLRMSRNLALATLPALVLGAVAYEAIKVLLASPETVVVSLFVGGLALLLLDRRDDAKRPATRRDLASLSATAALLIGAVQCLALIPSVSRSGATILGGLALGLERRAAAEFSFFLAVPTLSAAAGYQLIKAWDSLGSADVNAIAVGFIAAFVVALAAIRFLLVVVSRYGFAPFAWYRMGLAVVAMLWLSSGQAPG